MEYNGNGLLEEILSLRNHESWEQNNNPLTMNNDFCNNGWPNFNNSLYTPQTSSFFEEFSLPLFDQSLDCEFYHPICPPELMTETPPFLTQEESSYSLSLMEDNELETSFVMGNHQIQTMGQEPCKMEPQLPILEMGNGCGNVCQEKKGRIKKMDGQPSKNLMAERRRRKRLNDRLSMLRSVVPKISKMDRTSILGDTIEYMKELLERIKSVQDEMEVGNSSPLKLINVFKNVKRPNEILVTNSPKFEVERRNGEEESRIEMCCEGKPGLLLSTVTTLEALGLEIQHSVISCFNHFSMQASCNSQGMEQQRRIISAEDIKQELFRNAGYGGRCL